MITRDEVLQGLLALYAAPRYLEIGVFRGTTFHNLEAPRKVAVDPAFQFDVAAARRDNPAASYHEVPSDTYFGTIIDPGEQFDVIYLDGLHTAEQTLRDLLNALFHLAPDGIVVIDDVKPTSHLAAIPSHQRFAAIRKRLASPERSWMGDVYKVVYFIDSFLQQLSWRTVAENHGQSVVWRCRRPEVPERRIAEVGAKSFDDLLLEPAVLRRAPYQAILDEIRRDRGQAAVA
jgi:Methyltransferase domain